MTRASSALLLPNTSMLNDAMRKVGPLPSAGAPMPTAVVGGGAVGVTPPPFQVLGEPKPAPCVACGPTPAGGTASWFSPPPLRNIHTAPPRPASVANDNMRCTAHSLGAG